MMLVSAAVESFSDPRWEVVPSSAHAFQRVPTAEDRRMHASILDHSIQDANIVLRSTLAEVEDLLQSSDDIQVEAVESTHRTLRDRSQRCNLLLREYQDGLRHAETTVEIEAGHLIGRLGLTLSLADVQRECNVLARLNQWDIDLHHRRGQEEEATGSPAARRRGLPPAPAVSAKPSLDPPSQTPYVKTALVELQQLLVADTGHLPAAAAAQPSQAMHDLFEAWFAADGVTASRNIQLLQSLERLDVSAHVEQQLRQGEAACDAEVDKALHEADVGRPETAPSASSSSAISARDTSLVTALRHMDLLLHQLQSRVKASDMSSSKDGNVRADSEHAQAWLEPWFTAASARCATVEDYIKRDASCLRHAMQRHEADDAEQLDRFAIRVAATFDAIEAVEAAQDRVFEDMKRLAALCASLGRQRARIVSDHVAAIQAEKLRQRRYLDLQTAATRHRDVLCALLDKVTAEASTLHQLRHSVENTNQHISAKSFDSPELSECAKREMLRFARVFQRLVTVGSTIVGHREARLVVNAEAADVAATNANFLSQHVDAHAALASAAEIQRLEADAASMAQSITETTRTIQTWDVVFDDIRASLSDRFGLVVDDPFQAGFAEWKALVQSAMTHVVESSDHHAPP